MVTHPCRLTIESNGLDLGVHRESTSTLADGSMLLLEHGDDLMEKRCRFCLTGVLSPKDHRCRCERADLQSRLPVIIISTVRRN